MKKQTLLLISAFTLSATPLCAEVLSFTAKVHGIVCSRCATAIQQSVDGLRKKHKEIKKLGNKALSLKHGTVTFSFENGHKKTLSELYALLKKTMKGATFSLGPIEILTANGTIKTSDEKRTFNISGSGEQLAMIADTHREHDGKKKRKKDSVETHLQRPTTKPITLKARVFQDDDGSYKITKILQRKSRTFSYKKLISFASF